VPGIVRLGTQPVIEEMRSATDFRERSWIRAPFPPHERANGPGYVAIHREGIDYELDVDMVGSGWMVASIPAWKGWRAYIDGRRVETQRANHAFLSVYVPQGKHRVRLTYLPRSFVAGRAITIVTLAAIAIGALLRKFRKAFLQRGDGPLVALPGRE
jgi:hypothetical protein